MRPSTSAAVQAMEELGYIEGGSEVLIEALVEAIEAGGQPHAEVEAAAIDAARLPHPLALLIGPLRPGVSRHAGNQVIHSTGRYAARHSNLHPKYRQRSRAKVIP